MRDQYRRFRAQLLRRMRECWSLGICESHINMVVERNGE